MSENINSTFVTNTLLSLGLLPCSKGFHYLRKAIVVYVSHLDIAENTMPMKNVISETAEFFCVSQQSVKYAIQKTISSGWHRRDKEAAKCIFFNTLHGNYDYPSNSLFISAVGEYTANNSC